MPRIHMLAAGLAVLAGSLAVAGSAQACDERFAWICKSFAGFGGNNDTAQTQAAAAPQPANQTVASGRRHFVSRARRHRQARHHLLQHRSAHVAAASDRLSSHRPAELEAPAEEQPPAVTANSRRSVRSSSGRAGSIEAPSWAATRVNEPNVRTDALEPSHRTGFDLVAEWKRAVSELTVVNVWPEATLRSFNDFPP